MQSPLLLLWLSAATISFAVTADAATCSQAEAQSSYNLYLSAAKLSGCAPFATYSASGSVSIAYTCSSTYCVPIMKQLARQLPSCESATTGVNSKQQLEYGLYSQCKFCTDAQDDEITALWKAAAQTSSCSKYASSSSYSTSFSWPCSATGCTAVLKDLASKVPDCFTGTINEKNRILKAVSGCTSTTPSTNAPAPVSTSTSSSTTTPATRAPTTSTTSPSTTASPSTTSSPSNSSESGDVCSESEQSTSASIWEAAAADASCSKYATVTSTQVLIVWPCSSSSCTSVMEDVGDKLPSCVLPGLSRSEKATVQETVENCKAGGSGKDTSTSGTSDSSSTTTPAPSYSSSTCTATQIKSMASDYLATAKSSECAQYSNVTAFKISIYAPCTSTCVTKGFKNLADDVPNCYYAYEGENKKKDLQSALDTCLVPSSNGRERFLQTGEYVKLEFTATTTIDASASVAPAPATSSSNGLQGTGRLLWLVAACVLVLARV